jgi:predicted DNA-binding transcriptional regulator AlpA
MEIRLTIDDSALTELVATIVRQTLALSGTMGNVARDRRSGPEDDGVDRLLNINEVADRLGVNIKTVRNMIARNEFPPPIMLNTRQPRWSVAEFNAYTKELRRRQIAEAEAAARKRRGRRASA